MGLQESKVLGSTDLTLEEVARRPTLRPSDVPLLRLVPHSTYAVLSAHVYNDQKQEPSLPDGWEVLLCCSSINLDREGFYAMAYVNHSLKHCIVAQRGTAEVLGLRAGVWFYFEEVTIQFFLAEQFSQQVRLSLSLLGDADDYTISYTGHSLGAVLAAWRAVDEGVCAVTFESPGARNFLGKSSNGLPPSGLDTDVITYLRSPNPINTLKPHCGLLVMIPSPPVQLANSAGLLLPPMTEFPNPFASDAMNPPPSRQSIRTAAAAEGGSATDGTTTPTAPAASSAASATTATSATAAPPPSIFSAAVTRFRMPSIRPRTYFRDYMLSGVGMGVPELQLYVSKVEPMVRELLERTQQLHSIYGFVDHFQKEEADAMRVLRWPAHLMQFMEYYNTARALEDPDNQPVLVNGAYRAMITRLYAVEPLDKHRIPLFYVKQNSIMVVKLWWRWDAAKRRALPLTRLDHKALNCIRLEDGSLCTIVLTALQAKQYLARLVTQPSFASILSELIGDSNSVASKL